MFNYTTPFNSTRYIRNSEGSVFQKTTSRQDTFNSTRYIRNSNKKNLTIEKLCFQLHTVHQEPMNEERDTAKTRFPPFNSTRYIRNMAKTYLSNAFSISTFQLHTVHQELITTNHDLKNFLSSFQLHTVHQEPFSPTSHFPSSQLSTPHGTLGTSNDHIN